MIRVSLNELAERLHELLALARAGEDVFITDRNDVIARLVPEPEASNTQLPHQETVAAIQEGLADVENMRTTSARTALTGLGPTDIRAGAFSGDL